MKRFITSCLIAIVVGGTLGVGAASYIEYKLLRTPTPNLESVRHETNPTQWEQQKPLLHLFISAQVEELFPKASSADKKELIDCMSNKLVSYLQKANCTLDNIQTCLTDDALTQIVDECVGDNAERLDMGVDSEDLQEPIP